MSEDRRQFPRVAAEASLQLVLADGARVPALALDLSLTGVQVLCDRPTALRIWDKGDATRLTPADDVRSEVRMRLRCPDGRHLRVQAEVRVMSVREAGDDEYRVGLKYLEFHADHYDSLERFVDEWMDASGSVA